MIGTTGTTLKRMFSWLENVDCSLPETVCDCCEIAAEMDEIGPDECLIRIDEFADQITASAKKMGWDIPDNESNGRLKTMRSVIRQLIKIAAWKSKWTARGKI